jgi:hypothetical protein
LAVTSNPPSIARVRRALRQSPRNCQSCSVKGHRPSCVRPQMNSLFESISLIPAALEVILSGLLTSWLRHRCANTETTNERRLLFFTQAAYSRTSGSCRSSTFEKLELADGDARLVPPGIRPSAVDGECAVDSNIIVPRNWRISGQRRDRRRRL